MSKAELAYRLAVRLNVVDDRKHIDRLQQVVLAEKDAEWATSFAAKVPHADIPALQQLVIENDLELAGWFAYNVPEAEIKSLQDAVIKTKDTRLIGDFARSRRLIRIGAADEGEIRLEAIVYQHEEEPDNANRLPARVQDSLRRASAGVDRASLWKAYHDLGGD